MNRTWLALAFGDERQHAGNKGYADELAKLYRYDTLVPNHRNVAEGDLLLLRDGSSIRGVARVERITELETSKVMLRCPRCHKTSLKERAQKAPRFRCSSCRHEFAQPETTTRECTEFAAEFGGHFVATSVPATAALLRHACPRYNGQLAIQEIRLEQLPSDFGPVRRAASRLLALPLPAGAAEDDGYCPDGEDQRDRVVRQICQRRGQRQFRQQLVAKYGPRCVISGCQLLDILEAAHVAPYRGPKDNHASNGLLLRADLHTLFDLDLLAIDPTTLHVKLHPAVAAAGYRDLDDRRLPGTCSEVSRTALKQRWARFLERTLDWPALPPVAAAPACSRAASASQRK